MPASWVAVVRIDRIARRVAVSLRMIDAASRVLIDFPGSALHGKTVEVIEVENDFEYGPDCTGPIVWVRVPGLFNDRVAVHPAHISGTKEANERRRADSAEDGRRSDDRQMDMF